MPQTTLTVTAVPVLSDNYSWILRNSQTGATALIDPPDFAPIDAALKSMGGRLDVILLTHHHPDHVAAAEEFATAYGAKIIGAKADAYRLPKLDQQVVEGDEVRVGNATGVVIETPGHTVGHIAYYFAAGPILFCGDTLFSLGVGRFFEGTPAQMFSSLAKFASLPDETLVCCGHEYTLGNAEFAITAEPENKALQARVTEVRSLRAKNIATVPSTLGSERAANPFLRAATAERLGELREAKNRM